MSDDCNKHLHMTHEVIYNRFVYPFVLQAIYGTYTSLQEHQNINLHVDYIKTLVACQERYQLKSGFYKPQREGCVRYTSI